MKYEKIFHTPKEPNILNVLFPTILPFDFLMVAWYVLTLRIRKARFYFHGTLMIMKINKMVKAIKDDRCLGDFYSVRSMNKAEIMSEMFRFMALKNAAENDEKDGEVTATNKE